jgi:hypothetical protein
VTITGSYLAGATAVRFGPVPVAGFTVVDDSTITATSPPGSGTIDVTVTTPGGTSPSSTADQFSYTSTPVIAAGASPQVRKQHGAGFTGDVSPNGLPTTVRFEYGLDARYRPPGSSTNPYDQSTPPQNIGADFTTHTVSAAVSGLVPSAVYHVRLVASNSAGQTLGPDQTFRTAADPAPSRPVLGQKEDATPIAGQLFILKGGRLIPLTQAGQLPSGTVIDALTGTLKLTAAGLHGKLASLNLGGAIFKLTQTRAGLTTLTLIEGAFPGAPSYASCKPAPRAAATTAVSARILQTLRATGRGSFRTRGRYSAATVRGTTWDTSDRCDGTLTTVHHGTVLVADFLRRITLAVHAGQHYLARAFK